MPKTKVQKQATVQALVDKMSRAKSIVFANYAGLRVKEVTELRRKCLAEQAEYLVAKKTLMRRACQEAKIGVDPEAFPGEVATVFGYADEVAPARLLVEFAKDHPAVKPFGGYVEHAAVDAQKIVAFASLPSRKVLLSKAVGSIAAPLSGFVNVLVGNLRGLVQVLKAMSQKT